MGCISLAIYMWLKTKEKNVCGKYVLDFQAKSSCRALRGSLSTRVQLLWPPFNEPSNPSCPGNPPAPWDAFSIEQLKGPKAFRGNIVWRQFTPWELSYRQDVYLLPWRRNGTAWEIKQQERLTGVWGFSWAKHKISGMENVVFKSGSHLRIPIQRIRN